jgi:hypothetical protein
VIELLCRELSWEEKESKAVVIKNMFHPREARVRYFDLLFFFHIEHFDSEFVFFGMD